MPSEHQPAQTASRERFPAVQDHIGEDPARFLDFDLLVDRNMREMAFARIRGIDKIATCRAWIAIERNLDRGPRKKVIERLERRIEVLEEIGERPDRLPFGPRLPPEFFESADEDQEDEAAQEEDLTAHQKLTRMRMRADGGESDAA